MTDARTATRNVASFRLAIGPDGAAAVSLRSTWTDAMFDAKVAPYQDWIIVPGELVRPESMADIACEGAGRIAAVDAAAARIVFDGDGPCGGEVRCAIEGAAALLCEIDLGRPIERPKRLLRQRD